MASADDTTVIGPETRISGEVRGDEDLLVRGRLDGRVQLSQTLTIEDGGVVQADVDVRVLIVSGVLIGNITASESVRLTSKARVIGDVNAPRFVMDAGAAYRGRVQMGEGEADRPAERRAAEDRPVKAPPRLAPPARAAAAGATTSTVRAPAPPSAPPRVVTAPPRPPAPPSLPRPEVAAAGAPAWAKKKQLRRR